MDDPYQAHFSQTNVLKQQNPYQNGFNEGLYFEQMKQLENYETCKQCNRHFTMQEEQNGQKTMLQSTECFHLVHKDCLRDLAFG